MLKINKFTIILIIILLLSFILRLMYFNDNTAEWWDSADYMVGAKEIAGKVDLANYELSPRRPFFLSILWGGLIALDANDAVLHFSVVVFSMIAIFMVYLIGKELYNEKVGLIASLMLGVFWSNLFHTARLLTDVIASSFWFIALYFFIKGYLKNDKPTRNLILFGIFFGLSWFTRSAIIMMLIPLLIIILTKDKLRFLKKKSLWLAVLFILIAISPFFIYLFAQYENPIQAYTGVGEGRFEGGGLQGLISNTSLFINSLTWPFIIIFLIGLFFLLDFLLGLDLLFKKNDDSIRNKFLLFILLITPLIFFGLTFSRALEERYFFPIFPIAFIIGGYGLIKLSDYLNKYYKYLGIIIILGLLIWGSVVNISQADSLIKNKAQSYAEIKYAGEWIKANSNKDDVIMSASKFQNMYYSERDTIPFCPTKECMDNQELFLKRLDETKPKYVVLSIYESGFTPGYLYFIKGYIFAQDHKNKLNPVYWYPTDFNQQNPPRIVVYEYLS